MALTKLEVVNIGLTLYAKEPPLAALSDNPQIERLVDTHWVRVKRTMLSSYPWRFATERSTLVEASSNDRVNVWAYAYNRPGTELAIAWVNDPDVADMKERLNENPTAAYDLSPTTVYCDVPGAVMAHTIEIADDGLAVFPEQFIQALAASLAMNLAPLYTERQGLTQVAASAMEYWTEQAKVFDESQRPPARQRMPAHLSERGTTDPDDAR